MGVTLLLDTHALIWWLGGDERLSPAARTAIADPTSRVLVSAACAWEIATKARLGKLPGLGGLLARLPEAIAAQGFEPLDVTIEDALAAGTLPGPHRDPFDRMLIAQARLRDIALVSIEAPFDAYGVTRVW